MLVLNEGTEVILLYKGLQLLKQMLPSPVDDTNKHLVSYSIDTYSSQLF